MDIGKGIYWSEPFQIMAKALAEAVNAELKFAMREEDN